MFATCRSNTVCMLFANTTVTPATTVPATGTSAQKTPYHVI